MSTNNDILCFSKDKIFGSKHSDLERDVNPNNDDYIDVFSYDNLCQEYDFKTGDTSLYLEKSDGQYELLFETSAKNGIENASFYSKNSAFVLTGYNSNTGYIEHLDYFTKTNYIEFMNKLDKDYRFKMLNSIHELATILFMSKYSTKLIQNNVYYNSVCDNETFKEFKLLFTKYQCSTQYIPVSNILDGLISDIHSYISTGELDIITLKRRYSELQNFEKICPSSCALISSFIDSPDSTDLRSLCDSLEKNSNNIDKLISMYMEEELSIQTRGENDDCK